MIDIIIPAHKKDLNTLELCIEGARKNVKDVNNIYVISKNKLSDSAIWYPEEKIPFSIEDVAQKIGEHWRTSWYYADLLEGCSSIYVDGPSKYTLILDSDTIFLRPVSLIEKGQALLNTSPSDGTPAYYEYIAKLIPGLTPKAIASGITHWILQEKSIVKKMVDHVEDIHKKPFWEAALDITCQDYDCLKNNDHETGRGKMANFELYFTYVLKYHFDKVKLDNKNSILAYKESLGYPGYEKCSDEGSRTNGPRGIAHILDDEERAELKRETFESLSEAMEHVCFICSEKLWDVITFQLHFWLESEGYKDLMK